MKPSAIRNDISKKTKKAVAIAQPQFYQIMQSVIERYYGEWFPDVYRRTNTLRNSLDMSGVIPMGLGATGYVHFDAGKMSYSTGSWSGSKVLDVAMSGSHGGYIGGTPIWSDSIYAITPVADSILVSSCAAAGL